MPWYTLFQGRDKAFLGIFSTKVISDFNSVSKFISTDTSAAGRNLSFVVIDWQSGKVTEL